MSTQDKIVLWRLYRPCVSRMEPLAPPIEGAEAQARALGASLFHLYERPLERDSSVADAFREKEAAIALCELLPLNPYQINRAVAEKCGRSAPRLAAVLGVVEQALYREVAIKLEEARVAPLLGLDLFDLARLAADGKLAKARDEAGKNRAVARHFAELCVCSGWIEGGDEREALRGLQRAVIDGLSRGVFVGDGRPQDLGAEKCPIRTDLWSAFYPPRDSCFEFGPRRSLKLFDVTFCRAADALPADQGKRQPSPAVRRMLGAFDDLEKRGELRQSMTIGAVHRLVLTRCGVRDDVPRGMTYENFRTSPLIQGRLATIGIVGEAENGRPGAFGAASAILGADPGAAGDRPGG